MVTPKSNTLFRMRDGRLVHISGQALGDINPQYPWVGLIQDEKVPGFWGDNGNFSSRQNQLDLVEEWHGPMTGVVWVSVHRNEDGTLYHRLSAKKNEAERFRTEKHNRVHPCSLGRRRRGQRETQWEDKEMTFRPLSDYVLARRFETPDKSPGGVFIPEDGKLKSNYAEVYAVGPGAKDAHGRLIEMTVKEGDMILFGKWTGTEVEIDGETLMLTREADILGVA